MKVFFTVFFILTLFSAEDLRAGGYDYQPLEEMIAGVEVILIAQVDSVKPPDIMVKVSEVLAGSAKKSRIKLIYFLPEIWDGEESYHWLLPGSGIEISLEPGQTYIFLLTKTEVDGEYSLERAEEIGRKESVMEALGFSVHINKADEIIVYHSFMGSGKMSVEEFTLLLGKYMDLLEGNGLGVLITSEGKPAQSKVFSVVLELMFKPYVQVFYRTSI